MTQNEPIVTVCDTRARVEIVLKSPMLGHSIPTRFVSCIEVEECGRTTANLEQIVVPYPHDLFPSVNEDDAFLDDASCADDDWANDSENGRLGVHNCTYEIQQRRVKKTKTHQPQS